MGTHKVIKSKFTTWVIANRKGMESEFGLHINKFSLVGLYDSKFKVLQQLAKMTKRTLSYMVVSEFDTINGLPRKYKIGISAEQFIKNEANKFN